VGDVGGGEGAGAEAERGAAAVGEGVVGEGEGGMSEARAEAEELRGGGGGGISGSWRGIVAAGLRHRLLLCWVSIGNINMEVILDYRTR
jgi:hypothetical protein